MAALQHGSIAGNGQYREPQVQSHHPEDSDDPRTPLLPQYRDHSGRLKEGFSNLARSYGLVGSALRAASRLFTKSTIKATITYSVATLATFSQYSNEHLQGASYLFATAVLYFHPARSVGAMVEALLCCIVGLGAGFLIAWGCLHLALYYEEQEKNALEAHLIALTTLSVVTFILAFIRAKFGVSRPAVGTGCTLTHLLTFIVITQMASEKSLLLLSEKIMRVSFALLAGTCLSFLGCCLLWPKTAASVLRRDISNSLSNLSCFFDVLSNTFSLTPPQTTALQFPSDLPKHASSVDLETIESQHERLEMLVEEHQAMLLRMDTLRYEVSFEPTTSMYLHRAKYQAIFESAERLSQHLGGLQSSIVRVDTIITQDADNMALLEFMETMGDSLRQVIVVCKQSLSLIGTLFAAPAQNGHDADVILPALRELAGRLASALETFDATQRRVLLEIYKHVHEDVFLVFFFVFELLEIGKELIRLVNAVGDLKREVLERRQLGKVAWFLRAIYRSDAHGHVPVSQHARARFGRTRTGLQSTLEPREHGLPRSVSLPATARLRHDSPRTVNWSVRIWTFFSSLKKFEVRFAIKTAVTVALLALPAFLDSSQELFYEYRMHWALSTFVVVMTPSVGGTNAAGLWRILGTIGGALTALVAGILCADNRVALFFVCAVVALPCMFIFLHTKYPKIGQIYLLTFSIIVLNDYAGKVDPVTGKDYSIYEIAFRRGFAVVIGCVVGLFVSWYIWPFTARKALRVGLSNTLFDMGLLYSKLVGFFDTVDEPTSHDLLEFLEDELALRMSLAELRVLLGQTVHEPRLRGQFPRSVYAKMIDASAQILDKFVSMRIGVTKRRFAQIRSDFIAPVEPKRRKMIGSILLYFYILSGALILRYPLPPQLPNARDSRDRLIDAIRALPVIQPRHVGSQEDPIYIYYYMYVLGMDDVIAELEVLGQCCTELFGVMALGDMGDEWRNRWGDRD
ncbi:hypothetical protein SpCBS45565_g01571 [Spizellomyces sp. 'palustris']|nr:hypothetical protein SpCBS45565_g01571 [Spizellomyces sp. 'palustris']